MEAPVEQLRYSILDPTGNITALVESEVDVARQPAVAAGIMSRHAAVEQVGFVRPACDGHAQVELRMAGGEFCGNATMSAAALYLLRRGGSLGPGVTENVLVKASGAELPVQVSLECAGLRTYEARVHMPAALGIRWAELSHDGVCGTVPIVMMEGISHVVIEPDSAFRGLLEDRGAAEAAVRDWCTSLGVDGLGLMFLEGEGELLAMTPLVFIPGGDTVFWENSCASGSSAVGMYLAKKAGASLDLSLDEPGGKLRVESDPARGETWLFGRVRLTEEYQ